MLCPARVKIQHRLDLFFKIGALSVYGSKCNVTWSIYAQDLSKPSFPLALTSLIEYSQGGSIGFMSVQRMSVIEDDSLSLPVLPSEVSVSPPPSKIHSILLMLSLCKECFRSDQNVFRTSSCRAMGTNLTIDK